ncbi:MAG: disulfide bond formation protein B [Rhodobacteraceae bacterium]|nr:disulfide bond formation protein B [Paracoccaceae bacterium]
MSPGIGIAGSAALLAAAFGFQHIGGLDPCSLCVWQRWPHVAAILCGLLFVRYRHPVFCVMAMLGLLAGTGIAGFHAGVEQGWWAGLQSCSGGMSDTLSGGDLLDFTAQVDVVSCSDVVWSFMGLSMAVWNGLASLVLALIWMTVSVRNRPA